ncbi:MAG: helix-turn-helix domain-containing protein [Thomasclavelia ramosa]
MAKHLTDAKKKKIIADYVGCGNYSEVARKNKVSKDTVRRLCNRTDILQKAQEKKEQNTKDMLEYLDQKRDTAFKFIDKAFEEMCKEEKIEKTSIINLATAIGIVIDKYSNANINKQNEKVTIINDLPRD